MLVDYSSGEEELPKEKPASNIIMPKEEKNEESKIECPPKKKVKINVDHFLNRLSAKDN
jgi:hypothetical protein